MSLLTSFVREHLLKSLEEELKKHAPEIQQAVINEIQEFSNQALEWVKNKLIENNGEENES